MHLLSVVDATSTNSVHPASAALFLAHKADSNHQEVHPDSPASGVFRLLLAETCQFRVDPVDRVTEPLERDMLRREAQTSGICAPKTGDRHVRETPGVFYKLIPALRKPALIFHENPHSHHLMNGGDAEQLNPSCHARV